MEQKQLLTVNELARELKVKPSWVYAQTRRKGPGSIPCLHVGKYRRFLLEDVLDWLEERQNAG
jgi:excisionase family DNA binding protein